MQILLVRHAIAEDRVKFAATHQNDDLRPLTTEGIKKMQKTAKGLKTILSVPDMIVHSPLTRAVQTAEILYEVYGYQAKCIELSLLSPQEPPYKIGAWLKKYDKMTCIVLVGHEPDMGSLAGWLLAGNDARHFTEFKKGGMMLLEVNGQPDAGQAFLKWAMPPALLRQLV